METNTNRSSLGHSQDIESPQYKHDVAYYSAHAVGNIIQRF